jgi:hypothetical protein
MVTNVLNAAALTVQLVLPAFSDFSQKAGLDLSLPFSEQRVTKSYVSKNSPAVMATIDAQHQFNWRSYDGGGKRGVVNYYDNSNSLSRLQGERLLQLTERKSLITTNEAREIAYRFLRRAGYDLGKLRVGEPVVVQWTYKDERTDAPPKLLPGYDVRFIPGGIKKAHWSDVLLEIEVSGLMKRVTRFTSRRKPLQHGAWT